MRGRWGAIVAVLIFAAACTDGDGEAVSPPGAVASSTTAPPTCAAPARAGQLREGLDQEITLYLACDDGSRADETRLVPVTRVVPADRTPIDATLLQLFLAVETDEALAGLSSLGGTWQGTTYTETTVEQGIATLHLRESFEQQNNISTSNVSVWVYRQIEANVFQFPEIVGLEFDVGGERWCGFENTCDGVPYPGRTRP